MDTARHLDALALEGSRVAAVSPDHLEAVVPSLPDWTVERVVRHLGKVHRWVAGVLALAPDQGMDEVGAPEGIAEGPACLDDYAAAHAALLDAFGRRDPGDPSPTFVGPGTVGWWARRQCHEITVHRIDLADAVAAAGGPEPEAIAPDVAADGIDEWAHVFLATRFAQRFGGFPAELAGRSIHLHGTDDPPPEDGAEWIIRFAADPEGAVEIESVHAKGDAAVRGSSQALLLALWNRRPLDDVDVVGDRAVVERLLETATF